MKTSSKPLDTSLHLLVNRVSDDGLGVSLVPPRITLPCFLEKEIFTPEALQNFCSTEDSSRVRNAPPELSSSEGPWLNRCAVRFGRSAHLILAHLINE